MAGPTITCPHCKAEIPLSESLAAPLIEEVRRKYEQLLAQHEAEIARREEALAEKLTQERMKIAAEEARKAEQSSQQRQSEVREIALEECLMSLLIRQVTFLNTGAPAD